MNKSEFCKECFNWIKDTIINFRDMNPIEWKNLNIYFSYSPVIVLMTKNKIGNIWFDINSVPASLVLLISDGHGISTSFYLNTDTMLWESSKWQPPSNLETACRYNTVFQNLIKIAATIGILDINTFQLKFKKK